MSLIQNFMPVYRLREVDHLAVAADPARAFEAVRDLDLYSVGFARRLFAVRTLPQRLLAWWRGQSAPLAPTARIEQITAQGSGFHVLAETDREIVVGSVGRFWHPKIDFAEITPDTFRLWDVPGWGKLAWSIAVAPRGQDGSWITFDLRVDAFGPDAWRRFVRYWTLIGPFSRAIRRALFRRYRAVLGAAPPENSQLLPSDEVLPSAGEQITHSVFIEAPPARVWPWLVQMGCRRGGWYSWDQLDNAGVPSADRVIPNLQHIAVGDILPATPQGDDGFAVLRVDPERELTLGSPNLLPGGKSWGTPYDATWSFDLEPVGSDATRLIVRTRATLQPGAKTKVMSAVMPLLHDFMERKQLRTLKQRIEA